MGQEVRHSHGGDGLCLFSDVWEDFKAEVAQGQGAEITGSLVHPEIWWLMVAVGWDLYEGRQLEHLHVASPHSQGFLKAWQL